MKNTFFLNLAIVILLCMTATHAKAQLEVKVEPINVIFNISKISVETILHDKVGVEILMGLRYGRELVSRGFNSNAQQRGHVVRAIGKCYLFPKNKADRLYIGLYAGAKSISIFTDSSQNRITESDINAGVTIGYKWVQKSGIIFEIAPGVGRTFGREPAFIFGRLDGFLRLSLGYRF